MPVSAEALDVGADAFEPADQVIDHARGRRVRMRTIGRREAGQLVGLGPA
jgi:hypothetical protein